MDKRTLHEAAVPEIEDIMLQTRYTQRAFSHVLASLVGSQSIRGQYLYLPGPYIEQEINNVTSNNGVQFEYVGTPATTIRIKAPLALVGPAVPDTTNWGTIGADTTRNILYSLLADEDIDLSSYIPPDIGSTQDSYNTILIGGVGIIEDQVAATAFPTESIELYNAADPTNPATSTTLSRERRARLDIVFVESGTTVGTIAPEPNLNATFPNAVPLLRIVLKRTNGTGGVGEISAVESRISVQCPIRHIRVNNTKVTTVTSNFSTNLYNPGTDSGIDTGKIQLGVGQLLYIETQFRVKVITTFADTNDAAKVYKVIPYRLELYNPDNSGVYNHIDVPLNMTSSSSGGVANVDVPTNKFLTVINAPGTYRFGIRVQKLETAPSEWVDWDSWSNPASGAGFSDANLFNTLNGIRYWVENA